ncbi:MAG: hypothetical protein AB1714_05785 [Acidobacteriota bacterium]
MKRMIVSVGTSFFHSASWENAGPLADILGYSEWLNDYYLDRPLRRLSMVTGDRGEFTGASISDELRKRLSIENASEYTQYIAQDDAHPMRYSAELSTILRLYDQRRQMDPRLELGSYLANEYDSIVFLCGCSEKDPSNIAAHHVCAQLRKFAESVSDRVRVSAEIEGETLKEKARSFDDRLETLTKQRPNCDLILSGGYKIYSIQATLFLHEHPECRIIYLHEEDDDPRLGGFDARGYKAGDDL